jgi:hypothetical protein
MPRCHFVFADGAKDQDTACLWGGGGIACFFLTGEPGQGAIVIAKTATPDAAPATGIGQALRLATALSPALFFCTRSELIAGLVPSQLTLFGLGFFFALRCRRWVGQSWDRSWRGNAILGGLIGRQLAALLSLFDVSLLG